MGGRPCCGRCRTGCGDPGPSVCTPRACRALPLTDVGTTCCRTEGAPPRWRSWKPRREARSARDTGAARHPPRVAVERGYPRRPTPRHVSRPAGWVGASWDESTSGMPWPERRALEVRQPLETLLLRPQEPDEGEPDDGARLGRADDAWDPQPEKLSAPPGASFRWHQILKHISSAVSDARTSRRRRRDEGEDVAGAVARETQSRFHHAARLVLRARTRNSCGASDADDARHVETTAHNKTVNCVRFCPGRHDRLGGDTGEVIVRAIELAM